MERRRIIAWIVGATTISAGCQVRGLVGSDETAARPSSGSQMGVVAESSTGVGAIWGTSSGGAGATGAPVDTGIEDDGQVLPPDPKFDLDPTELPFFCIKPATPPCDSGFGTTWWEAIGLCTLPPHAQLIEHVSSGAMQVHRGGLGVGTEFLPREGDRMLILSTGRAQELPLDAAQMPDGCTMETCPDTNLGGYEYKILPLPLIAHDVSDAYTCAEHPELIGHGDCSNSIAKHFARGEGAYDYSQLQLRLRVPEHINAVSYEFAFFSSEYPLYIDKDSAMFNDMFVAWLESEQWTGNISFDERGSPITVQTAFLDYRTDSEECPDCTAPELAGFAMQGHAGTKWLTTTAPVSPGEDISLTLAIFDLTDSRFDSAVIVDNFEWTCADGERPVTKKPAG